MPLPPLYFPVYTQHFRLPEPGLHAQPMISSPPILHVEGFHTMQWVSSDTDKLSSTVYGDNFRIGMKDYNSGKLIPHAPVPLMGGPFLSDTWRNSKYVLLFHQPSVMMDKQPVAVFFWGVAAPWRCMEIMLPMPKFMKRLTGLGALRKVNATLRKADEQIARAKQKVEQLEGALVWADEFGTLSPAAVVENAKAVAAEQAKREKAEASQEKARSKYNDARKLAAELDRKEHCRKKSQTSQGQAAGEGAVESASKPAAGADKEKQRTLNERIAAAKQAEQAALHEKREADRLERAASREADEHEADSHAQLRSRSSDPDRAADSVNELHDRAQLKRQIAAEAAARSQTHQKAAKEAAREASLARREKGEKHDRQERGREFKEKHGKSNPYKEALGLSNTQVDIPSALCHLPFPATVQIYMSTSQRDLNWKAALLSSLANVFNAYVGVVFDSVWAPGKGAVATWAIGMLKTVVQSGVNTGKEYLTDHVVHIVVSTKVKMVTVKAELKEDKKTHERTWSVTTEAGSEKTIAGQKGEGKVSGSISGKLASEGRPAQPGDSTPAIAKHDASFDKWSVGAEGKADIGSVSGSVSHADNAATGKSTWTESAKAATPVGVGSRTATQETTGGQTVSKTETKLAPTYGHVQTTTTTDGAPAHVQSNDNAPPPPKVPIDYTHDIQAL